MDRSLFQYRLLPSVVEVGVTTEIAIRALDVRQQPKPDASYEVLVRPLTRRHTEPGDMQSLISIYGQEKAYRMTGGPSPEDHFPVRIEGANYIFSFTPDKEENYSVVLLEDGKDVSPRLEFYALEKDLFERRPLKGDFHSHSCRSDGDEGPALVAANYRAAGYDFNVLSDHRRYEPSVEMQNAYQDVKVDMLMVNGEEVHAPENFVHIIHFGGTESVNEMYRQDPDGYHKEVAEMAENDDIPNSNKYVYAACCWVARKIHSVGGLAVYCHPHWIYNLQHNDPDDLTRDMLRSGEFDAFELIGGQTHMENDLQVAIWNDLRAEGTFVPPLSASDEHSTLNGLFNQMFTIVFAKELTPQSIIDAVKNGYCAAVEVVHRDTASKLYYGQDQDEYDVHASYRLVAYTRFLLRTYFPGIAALAAPEGQLMREYVHGAPGAKEALEALSGRTEAFYNASFGR